MKTSNCELLKWKLWVEFHSSSLMLFSIWLSMISFPRIEYYGLSPAFPIFLLSKRKLLARPLAKMKALGDNSSRFIVYDSIKFVRQDHYSQHNLASLCLTLNYMYVVIISVAVKRGRKSIISIRNRRRRWWRRRWWNKKINFIYELK